MSAFLNLLYVTKATTNWTDKTFNSLLNFATLRIVSVSLGSSRNVNVDKESVHRVEARGW